MPDHLPDSIEVGLQAHGKLPIQSRLSPKTAYVPRFLCGTAPACQTSSPRRLFSRELLFVGKPSDIAGGAADVNDGANALSCTQQFPYCQLVYRLSDGIAAQAEQDGKLIMRRVLLARFDPARDDHIVKGFESLICSGRASYASGLHRNTLSKGIPATMPADWIAFIPALKRAP